MSRFSLEGGQSKAFRIEQSSEDDVYILRKEGYPRVEFHLRRIKDSQDFLLEDPITKKTNRLRKVGDFPLWQEINNLIKEQTGR